MSLVCTKRAAIELIEVVAGLAHQWCDAPRALSPGLLAFTAIGGLRKKFAAAYAVVAYRNHASITESSCQKYRDVIHQTLEPPRWE